MKNPKPYLPKGEQKAIEELVKRKDIFLTSADKGSAAVIMDVEKHIKNANCLLSDPTLQHSNLVNDTIDKCKKENLLSKKLDEGLKSVNPKPPKFTFHPRYIKKTTQKAQL